MEDNFKLLKQKSIAVSSGKGGVGKTTTAVNLAIYYARKNYRVGLIDLDPLSDIAVLLDIKESEHIMRSTDFDNTGTTLDAYKQSVFHNLDLLFPSAKLGKTDSRLLREKLYIDFVEELIHSYDLLIYDMPAGMRSEDNLAFLPYMGALIIVTNSDPASHVSAGGYIRVVLDQENDFPIFIWHNRFVQNPGADFNPEDVIGNYNRNTPKAAHISLDKIANIEDLAFIPDDRSMDLLQTNPSVTLNIQRSLLDILEFLKEERLKHFAISCRISEKTFHLVKYFLFHRKNDDNVDLFINELGNYIGNIIKYRITRDKLFSRKGKKIPSGRKIFTAEQIDALQKLYHYINTDALRNRTVKVIHLLENSITKYENEKRIFFIGNTTHRNKQIDIEISKLLLALNNQRALLSETINNTAGLLLFYFSLYKLFHSKTLLKLVNDFIPVRRNSKGNLIRDKHIQIRNIIENSSAYRERYFNLIRTLFPVITKQVTTIVETFGLSHLYYCTPAGKINKLAYVKLFSHFLHDTVNSGLGIIVGFRFRPASIAFRKAAEKLLGRLTNPPLPSHEKAAS